MSEEFRLEKKIEKIDDQFEHLKKRIENCSIDAMVLIPLIEEQIVDGIVKYGLSYDKAMDYIAKLKNLSGKMVVGCKLKKLK